MLRGAIGAKKKLTVRIDTKKEQTGGGERLVRQIYLWRN